MEKQLNEQLALPNLHGPRIRTFYQIYLVIFKDKKGKKSTVISHLEIFLPKWRIKRSVNQDIK